MILLQAVPPAPQYHLPSIDTPHFGDMGLLILALIVIIVVILAVPRPHTNLKHWNHYFPNTSFSSKEIFEKIIEGLKEEKMPSVKAFNETIPETSIVLGRRYILRIRYKRFFIDVTCSQFGTGYYVSWWLNIYDQGFFSRIPYLNTLLGINPSHQTYFQLDRASMFQSAAHSIILDVIANIATDKGYRALTEQERLPVNGLQMLKQS